MTSVLYEKRVDHLRNGRERVTYDVVANVTFNWTGASHQSNTISSTNLVLMLGQRRRQWANIETTTNS